MNLAYFISNRISKQSDGTFSAAINRIAVVSTGLGLAVLLVAFMVLLGFKAQIKNKIYSFSGHLIVNKYTLSTSFEETSISVSDSLLHQLSEYPLTERIQPYAMKAGLIKAIRPKAETNLQETKEVQGVIMKGVDHHFDTATFKKHLIIGKFPDFSGKGYSTQVALSQKIANYLQLKVGGEVMIYFVQDPPRFRKLQVVGIYETGLEEFDEKIIIGDLDLIRRINGWNESQAGGIELFINDLDQLENAESDLFNSLDINLYVNKVTDKYVQIFDWLNLLNRNVVILLTIILFVVGTSIISILLILIMERTQMIGVMKSLGASNRLIQSVFIWNGIRLIVKGLILGNIVGISLGLIQYFLKIIPLDTANYYMSHVPIEFDIVTIIGLNVLVLSIVGLTLFIPVTIISKVQPIKAIQFD
ncbi:MAG: FtsX-like permease family protein [Bacteroidota bacterium]